jgi:hypothetical protein
MAVFQSAGSVTTSKRLPPSGMISYGDCAATRARHRHTMVKRSCMEDVDIV